MDLKERCEYPDYLRVLWEELEKVYWCLDISQLSEALVKQCSASVLYLIGDGDLSACKLLIDRIVTSSIKQLTDFLQSDQAEFAVDVKVRSDREPGTNKQITVVTFTTFKRKEA